METVSLLRTAVRSRKDVVRVLQQARQLARLLRFTPLEQVEIGCQAFALALEMVTKKTGAAISFHLCQGSLVIESMPAEKKKQMTPVGPPWRFSKSLPGATELSREDFIWVIAQLQVLLKVNVLEVIRQQNNDLLAMLEALHCCRNDLDQLRRPEPSAA